MMDWLDQKMPHEVIVQMVPPQDIDAVLGVLDGVDLSGSSLSASASTDTRTSGKLRVKGDGYIRNSWLRVIVRFPNFEKELGTYAVAGEPYQVQHGVYDYELQSLLWAYAQDECPYPLTVGEGQWVMRCAKRECGNFRTSFCELDAKTTEAITYDAGTNRLKRHYDLCAIAGVRPDIDGHGVFTTAPEDIQVTPEYTLSLADVRGIVHPDVERESDFSTRPNRAGVNYKWNDDGEHALYAHMDSTGPTSVAERGYAVTQLRTLEELDPPTQAHANEEAAKLLGEFAETVTWKVRTRFLPIWENDWVYFDVSDADPIYGGVRTCRVESLDLDLLHLDMQLTLEERIW